MHIRYRAVLDFFQYAFSCVNIFQVCGIPSNEDLKKIILFCV